MPDLATFSKATIPVAGGCTRSLVSILSRVPRPSTVVQTRPAVTIYFICCLAGEGELQVAWASVHVGIEKGKRTQYVMGRDWICRCVRCVITGVYWEAALKMLALEKKHSAYDLLAI